MGWGVLQSCHSCSATQTAPDPSLPAGTQQLSLLRNKRTTWEKYKHSDFSKICLENSALVPAMPHGAGPYFLLTEIISEELDIYKYNSNNNWYYHSFFVPASQSDSIQTFLQLPNNPPTPTAPLRVFTQPPPLSKAIKMTKWWFFGCANKIMLFMQQRHLALTELQSDVLTVRV